MLKYALFAFFACFVLKNLHARSATEDPYADLKFPNFSIIALDESQYRAFPATQTDKTFVVVAYIKANWYRAQEICSYQGLSLASVRSEEENRMLRQYLQQAGLATHGDAFWLGGSRLSEVGRYIWFNTGRPISYYNWHPGQPDNAGGNEKCVEMVPGGKWNDLNCEAEKFFICETRCPLTSYDAPFAYQRK